MSSAFDLILSFLGTYFKQELDKQKGTSVTSKQLSWFYSDDIIMYYFIWMTWIVWNYKSYKWISVAFHCFKFSGLLLGYQQLSAFSFTIQKGHQLHTVFFLFLWKTDCIQSDC